MGKESDVKAYDSEKIETQINEKTKVPYLLISPRISNYLNGFVFNDNIDSIKLFKFAILHEYDHCFEYLKELVEKDSAKLVDTRLEVDRENVVNSEGRANTYALKNMYRKGRRELLMNAEEDNSNIVSQEYVKGTKRYFKY